MTEFYVRRLSESPIPETEPKDWVTPEAPRSNGRGGRVIGPATARYEVFAITVNGDTMEVVPVDLERGVPVWKGRSSKLTKRSGETLWLIK